VKHYKKITLERLATKWAEVVRLTNNLNQSERNELLKNYAIDDELRIEEARRDLVRDPKYEDFSMKQIDELAYSIGHKEFKMPKRLELIEPYFLHPGKFTLREDRVPKTKKTRRHKSKSFRYKKSKKSRRR
jgi:hypothetical protein